MPDRADIRAVPVQPIDAVYLEAAPGINHVGREKIAAEARVETVER
jgi:hypothetical protein